MGDRLVCPQVDKGGYAAQVITAISVGCITVCINGFVDVLEAPLGESTKERLKKQHSTKSCTVRQQYTLPGSCVRLLENNQGIRRVVAGGCLERHYASAGLLPRYSLSPQSCLSRP